MISEKTKLTLELFAILVSRPVTEHKKTQVTTVNNNSLGIIEVKDISGGHRSKHQFVIKDTSVLGIPEPIKEENSKYFLALLCSLTNPDVLFSPIDLDYGEYLIEYGKQTSDPVVSNSKVQLCTTTKVTTSLNFVVSIEHKFSLEEQKILDLTCRLIAFNPFSTINKCSNEMNILGAIQSYRRALTDTDIFECFSSLYEAFEKGVLADNPQLTGDAFDIYAKGKCGYQVADIKELREFNNRLKHALRGNDDLKALQIGEKNIENYIKKIKLATDTVILSRLPN